MAIPNEITEQNARNYTLLGVLFGLTFPAVSFAMYAAAQSLPLSLSTIAYLHQAQPVHYLIDTAPFGEMPILVEI
jgi:hypothetical protein